MIRSFDIQGDKIDFTPEFLAVPQFKAIWDRDKTKNKKKAIDELSFIVFLCDNRPENPYSSYSENIRKEVLAGDFFHGTYPKNDELIEEGIKKLYQLFETTSTRLLAGAQIAADELSEWFKNIDFTRVDDNGKPIYSASELARNLSAVGNIVKS